MEIVRSQPAPHHLATTEPLVRASAELTPSAVRRLADARIFRGRVPGGPVELPAQGFPDGIDGLDGSSGLTAGFANRPLLLSAAGVAHSVRANVPWLVPAGTAWRLLSDEPADLRLVHTRAVAPPLVTSAVGTDRPTKFSGQEAKIVRAALTGMTPVWVDRAAVPVRDLAAPPRPDWRLVGTPVSPGTADRDQLTAFVLMLTWALERRAGEEDPRMVTTIEYIRTRLHEPTLSAATISEQLRISRRSLQSLFARYGGVAGYVRRRRVAAVLHLISQDPHQLPDLEEVARTTGLGSRRTLERAVREVHGITPGQARTLLLSGRLLQHRAAG